MSGPPQNSLLNLLYEQDPDVNLIIDTFVSRFNAVYGDPAAVRWDISKEEWQRYAFLGDRVLNLIVVQALFTRSDGALSKGKMTRILSAVVSNHALDTLSGRFDWMVFSRLVPVSVGGENACSERITGGAFEAFIGALYCEMGLDDVTFFVMALLADSISTSDPSGNAIGILQEYFQKRYRTLPTYRQMKRSGPDHKPVYIYQVLFNNEVLGEGSGESIQQAQQAAARQALDTLVCKP